jgi:hypothetical protein
VSSINKAFQAVGLKGVSNANRFSEQIAKVHTYSHLERPGSMAGQDDMIIDSPTTHYHATPPNPWPWVMGMLLIIAAAAIGGAALMRPPAPIVHTTPAPPAPAQPGTGYSIGVYEP